MKRSSRRKIKKFFHKNSIFLLMVLIIPLFFFMSVGYSLMTTQLSVNGKAKLPGKKDPEDVGELCNMTYSYVIQSEWTNNCIADITIYNHNDYDLQTWGIKFRHSENLKITSNHANVYEQNSAQYVTAMDWNAIIPSKSNVTFQVQMTTIEDMKKLLDDVIIVACGRGNTEENRKIKKGNAELELASLEFELDVDLKLIAAGDWGGQVNRFTIVLTNNNDFDVLTWRGMLYYGNNATDATTIYEAFIKERTGTYFIFSDNGGNGAIPSGGSIEMNLVVYTSDPTFVPDVIAAGVRNI